MRFGTLVLVLILPEYIHDVSPSLSSAILMVRRFNLKAPELNSSNSLASMSPSNVLVLVLTHTLAFALASFRVFSS